MTKLTKYLIAASVGLLALSVIDPVFAITNPAASELAKLKRPLDFQVELIYGFRIFIAFIFGCIIGICHDKKFFQSGTKIYGALALGAAAFSSIALHAFFAYDNAYSMMIGASIVAGIGFLAGGVIFKQQNMVKGLSSSATLWATASIGMACGFAMYYIAILITILLSIFHIFTKNPNCFED